MDINKYKVDNDMYVLRDSIKSKYDELIKLFVEIDKLTKPIVESKIEEFINDFKSFFEEHGFKISSDYEGTVVATNDRAEFKLELSDKGTDYVKFLFKTDESKYREIFIECSEDSKEHMKLKSDPGLSDFKLNDFQIKNNTTVQQLINIDTAMDENIKWLQQTLLETDQLEFVIYSYNDVYKDFKDFFEKI